MTIDYPSYYNTFRCVGGSCKDSCCIGWEVDIDQETWDYYQTVKGSFGNRLRAHMKDDGTDRYFPMCEDGRCPFLNKMNLCDIITNLGEESLSQVCTEYPRYFLEEGSFTQIDLSLSCMELGRIFFEDPDPVEYIREEFSEGVDDAENDTATSEPLLKEILDIRDDCIAIIQNRSVPLMDRFCEIIRLYGPTEWRKPCDPSGDVNVHTDLIASLRPTTLLPLMRQLEVLVARWVHVLNEITMLAEDSHLSSYLPWTTTRSDAAAPCPGEETFRKANERESADIGFRTDFPLPEEFENATEGHLGIWFEKLACYFLFRYVTDAYFQERDEKMCDVKERDEKKCDEKAHSQKRHDEREKAPRHAGVAASIRLAARSICFLYLMCVSRYLKNEKHFSIDDIIDLAHLYSKEVEHSDWNVDFLKS